jgi:hypothetical protein
MSADTLPEVWLRGPVEGYAPVLMPAAHALLQVREDLARLADSVPPEQVWMRPGGAASIGFHIRHTGGALDRLLTYARGEALTDEQRHELQTEEEPGRPPVPLAALVGQAIAAVDRALAQLRTTDAARVFDHRSVGRAGLPSTILGLIVHAAEHSTRHVGQALTTARILRGTAGGAI